MAKAVRARARTASPPASILDVLLELPNLGVGEAGEDIALIVGCDLLGRSELRVRRNEGRDLAVLGAADADALLEARIGLLVGLRIRHVEHVVLVDEDRARPSELLPFGAQSGANLMTSWPLPLPARPSETHTAPVRSTENPCGQFTLPPPKFTSSLPDGSNFITGSRLEPSQVSAPQRSYTQTLLPSVSMAMPMGAPN